MEPPEEDLGPNKPKFGFRIYENFRSIVKKSRSNYDLSEAHSPTYEDVEVTGSHALSSLDSSMTTDSLNVIKNDGNATDDSGIDSIDQSGNNSSPEPLLLKSIWKKDLLQDNIKKVPIYSAVLKKKSSNPARDFALTVLENDKKAVKAHSKETCDLTEISKLLTTTNQLLTRNNHLRASLTIRVAKKSSNETTFLNIDLNEGENLRKDSTSGDSGNASNSDKCETSEEESSESTLPSLEPAINPFTRSNPARRPINGPMEVRRSIRLAPKTVATLASKFDNLLTNEPKEERKESGKVKLGKKDIAQIIGTLEKLDEDAKKATEVLQKNKKKDTIDNLMKSAKSALEEVELPSETFLSELEEPQTVTSSSTVTTDKYLQTLQKIAKENAETGQFRTSLPKEMKLESQEKQVIENVSSSSEKDKMEEPLDLVVTATPAIVTEDQMDSLSFYDDVKAPSLGGDLYESIAGSILNLAKMNSSMEDMYSSVLYSPQKVSVSTRRRTEECQFRGSMRSSSVYSEAGQKSVTSDEWIDLEEETDDDDKTSPGFARASNARNSHHRLSTRKRWQNRSMRRNWAQITSSNNAKKDGGADEELYESIYEVIQPKNPSRSSFESESDFDEIPEDRSSEISPPPPLKTASNKLASEGNHFGNDTKLTKLAEAANKKMRKLRRNWSLKKSDISKSWSRIRKYSSPAMMRPSITISHANTLKRKPSRKQILADPKSVVRHHGGPVVGDGSPNDTTFYITLTIEQDDDDDEDPLERLDSSNATPVSSEGDKTAKKKGWRPKRRVGGGSTSTSGASSSSHAEPDDSRSATISMSGSSVISGITSKSSPDSSLLTDLPPRLPKPRKASVTRPTEAPPAPPPRRPIRPISFMLGPNASPQDLYDGPLASEAAQETYMSSFFQTEPLYQQFYTNQHLQEEAGEDTASVVTTSEDMYECVEHPESSLESTQVEMPTAKIYSRPSAMDLTSACTGGRRSMWSELPEVMTSGILDNISGEAKKLHEAMFEVITSEASYLKSLNILMKHFAQSPKLSGMGEATVISKWDHKRLFGDVINVRQCSERFLEDLERKWQASVLLDGLCEVVRDHARTHFQVYVKYCSNQVDQGKLLKELSENPRFVEALKELESSPICQALKMQSFLMLPMQRITRLPLLIGAIFSRLEESSAEHEPCQEALQIIEKLVHECNDSALIEGRRKEMLLLEQQLKFRGDVKLFPLCSASRWLVKRGDATRIYWKENAEAKLTFGRKVSKQTYNFLLFNDILVIAKKKSDGNFSVVDYCPRNLVQMSNLLEEDGKLPYGMANAKNIDLNQVVLFTMLQNHEHKTIEWLLTFPSEAEKGHWIDLVTPNTTSPENPEEKIYQDWDCPLVEAVASIEAENSNEVALQKGERANVLRKLSDTGWYYVEKLNDGQKGWVPMSATREIESNHIRARNFRQRHAFLKLLTSMDSLENTNDLLNNNNNNGAAAAAAATGALQQLTTTNRYSYYDD